jgi:hypothetical protein
MFYSFFPDNALKKIARFKRIHRLRRNLARQWIFPLDKRENATSGHQVIAQVIMALPMGLVFGLFIFDWIRWTL